MSRQNDERIPTAHTETGDAPAAGQSRRGFMRAVGGGAVALGALSAAGSAAAQDSKPRLVFTYDDGYVQDYTQTFSVHKKFDAPACVAVPSNNVGRSNQFLSESQLTEMTNSGWELMSHGINHEAIGPVSVTADVAPGDTKVYTDSTVLARTPNDVEIYDGDNSVVRKLTGDGEDDSGSFLKLDSEVGQSFSQGAQVRFTEEVVRTVLEKSKQALSQYDQPVNGFVLPYGRFDDRSLSLVKEYYEAVPNVHRGGMNPGAALRPYRLSRRYFDEERMTEAELKDFLDRVASRNAVGLLGGHSRNQALTGERIQLAIELAQERDIEIVTLTTALQELGFVEQTETPTETSTTTGSGTSEGSSSQSSDDGGGSFLDRFIAWITSLFS